ncbi:hypothetical protein GA0115246_1010214 [Streptomyces sp. SolWspMP-sol7th]|nr:hypothetical protein GA0115246_1010214 [Streptomyces sp. SolWspMP-sol7th]
MLGALDVEAEVLAPRGDDLLVEQGVPVDGGEIRLHQVFLSERRENTDHQYARVPLRGLPVRVGETRAEFFGELVEDPATEAVRGDIDLKVEHSQLGLEIPARDAFEHFPVDHSGETVGTREIEFDLQAHEVLGAVEAPFPQKSLQTVQTLPQLRPVASAVGQVEYARHDLLPHRTSPPGWAAGAPATRSTVDDAPAR